MKTNFFAAAAGVLLCLPCVRGQGLKADYEVVKQRRLAAIAEVVAPLDKKFTEAADLLAARAIKQENPELAARIKRERVPETTAKFRSNAFDNTYWKLTEGKLLSMYRIDASGVIEEISFYNGGPRTQHEGKWELVDGSHAKYGTNTLTVKDNTLFRDAGAIWVPSDKATFEKYSKATYEAEAKAAVGKQ